jgi:hypothetical protein
LRSRQSREEISIQFVPNRRIRTSPPAKLADLHHMDMLGTSHSVTDAYFYLELLRIVGPEASNQWLERCANHRAQTPSQTNSSSINFSTSARSDSKGQNRPDQRVLQSHPGTSSCNDASSRVQEENSAVSGDINVCEAREINTGYSLQKCRNYTNTTTMTASDIELTAEPSSHMGLLFTDAAHIVLDDCGFRELLAQRRKSNPC